MAKTQKTVMGKGAKVAFIGGGNMAESLVRGLLRSGTTTPASIRVSDVLPARLGHLRRHYRLRTTSDNAEAAKGADILFLAVKPQDMDEALEKIAPEVTDSQLVVSIMAGVPTKTIEARLGGRGRVVRVMPNAAALIGKGAAGVAGGKKARKGDIEMVVGIFQCVGRALAVDESHMDAVTGLSGSGPARGLGGRGSPDGPSAGHGLDAGGPDRFRGVRNDIGNRRTSGPHQRHGGLSRWHHHCRTC
jgi:pyrroline-5-carboxylate reductase